MHQVRGLLQSQALNEQPDCANHHADLSRRATYHIRVEGQLGQEWADWFEGVAITPEPTGDTLLCCAMLDQAGLFGVLKKVRDLGMPLVSVNRVHTASLQPTLGSAEASIPDPVEEENT
jgi:hypothetical protein